MNAVKKTNKVPIHPLSYRGEDLQERMNSYWARSHRPEAMLEHFDDDLKTHAIFMAENGVNPRKSPVLVGAVIVGLVATQKYNPNRPNRLSGTQIIVLEGSNMSRYKGDEKDCAELRAMRMGDERVGEKIERGQYKLLFDPLRAWMAWKAMSLHVASNGAGSNLEINGIEAGTLHCCLTPCQPYLKYHTATPPDMPVNFLTYGPDTIDRDTGTRKILAEERYVLENLTAMYESVEPPAVSSELMAQKQKNK